MMRINELKCIDVLMRTLITNGSLSEEILSDFSSYSTYETARNSVFNIISINNVLQHFTENPPFSLESFLNTGIIPNLYEDKIATPSVDKIYLNDYKEFYKQMLEAFKTGDYTFDGSGNIYVASDKIETIIPEVWLHRLSIACRKNNYKQMFFYNKRTKGPILDKNDLIDFLRQSKTFLVTLTSANPNNNLEDIYSELQEKILNGLNSRSEVKVDSIINRFKRNAPKDCEINISKYKLADAFWLLAQAEKEGLEFYNKSLKEQMEDINKWMLEFINSNERSINNAQLYVLLSGVNKNYNFDKNELSKKDVIAGLFSTYIYLLNSLDLDFNDLSISSFKLERYMNKELENNLIKYTDLIKELNSLIEDKERIRENLDELLSELNDTNKLDDNIYDSKTQEYKEKLGKYKEIEQLENEKTTLRNQLQALISNEQENSLESIAFNNELIMSLILEATKKGRIYLNIKGTKLNIELYNDQLGKIVFKASISMDNLLSFMENVNNTLADYFNPPSL